MGALETLQAKFGCQLLFVESGGDNLAANYSRELADYIIYVIDVSVRKLFIRLVSFQLSALVGRRQDPQKGRPWNIAIRFTGDQQGKIYFNTLVRHI